MKRIENYRTGDRAEKLGVVLLQAFCAVAEIPRQEDFGLVDVVATLLRRDNKCWCAEDSFLVQIKSRTERQIEYLGDKWDALLSQDLPLLIAHVDLTQSSVELHTLGTAMAQYNFTDAKGLVAYLQPDESCVFSFTNNMLHVPFRKPILRWTTKETESRPFTDQAYTVLKAWLTIERWNRRYRQAGIIRPILWETNEVPTADGEIYKWNRNRCLDTLTDLVPFVRLIGMRGMEDAELRAPTRALLSWLRDRGVEADPDWTIRFMLQKNDSHEILKKALDRNTRADVAITFWIIEVRPDFLNFWLYRLDRDGNAGGTRHAGSPQALQERGFETKVELIGDKSSVTIGLSDDWLGKHHLAGATKLAPDTSSQEQGAIEVLLLQKQ